MGRLIALLLAQFRRLDLVEDALGDAVATATERWPRDGVPAEPAAWLLTAARRRVLDRLRAEAVAARRRPLLVVRQERAEESAVMADPGDLLEDDLLRLVLMCAHPALTPDAASALTLRLVLGVSTHDVARLFLVSEPTMAARLTRAKKKIVAAGIPFAVPGETLLPERLGVLARTAYLAFTAGYAPGSGPDLLRAELAGEAVRLVRVVRDLRPGEPVLTALLALMLLQHSRRDARVGENGSLVLLADQDRSRWHRAEIGEGLTLLTHPVLHGPLPTQAAEYAVQAAVAAEHATAQSAEHTRWDRVVAHYDALLRVAPSDGVRLARAVAVAEVSGPHAALAELEGVTMPGSHRPDAVRAELLARAGDPAAARAAFARAVEHCRNDVERAHLLRRRESVG